MTTINNIIPASLLVDQENVTIPYSAETVRLNERIARDTVPFSKIGHGRFRKLFNRHATAYRR
ncbi:hypothetical protein [Tunicatimonas pelagia]|uniref:hypothetical protein n=1 Tax=Tunicatimonas pelagia TaxID=931531 RepID=UPI00266619B6|nr:hypothetical protein [Tunicatimonas pelagia]WKN40639.1 hypothetical protein P0M28_16495 [Tunicatimonas pelagia]